MVCWNRICLAIFVDIFFPPIFRLFLCFLNIYVMYEGFFHKALFKVLDSLVPIQPEVDIDVSRLPIFANYPIIANMLLDIE